LYANYGENEDGTSSGDDQELEVDWGALNDQEKFIQACESSSIEVLMQLIDSYDSNLIEGDLNFFINYAQKFEDRKSRNLVRSKRGTRGTPESVT
jgi:hypothetical protein